MTTEEIKHMLVENFVLKARVKVLEKILLGQKEKQLDENAKEWASHNE